MSESEFVLKTTPPRMPRMAMERHRLVQHWNRMHDCAAVSVVAPAGFGKTTLLLQWRQRWLEQGARVAWLGADPEDDPARFTVGLMQAARSACAVRDSGSNGRSGVEALTWMLSEIARNGARTVIVIDDAERLPEATVQQALQYLLLNAPANLHVAIGSRVPLPLQTAELVAKDNFLLLTAQDLRLQLEESIEILEARLGERLTMDERAIVHDATEGWPIGLQLAIAGLEHEADAAAAVRTLSARRGNLQNYFGDYLLAALPADAAGVLTRIAILEHFNDELCEAVAGASVSGLLQRLLRETPIVMAGERQDWFRLHPLVRDFLLGRFEQLPAAEQQELHARAARWYQEQGRLHDAANHALAAGNTAQAQEYAARALWMLGALGKVEQAREWVDRLPAELMSRDPKLRLGAASVLAFSERNVEGLQVATEVLADPDTPKELTLVALRVASAAACFSDHLGTIAKLVDTWPAVSPASADALYIANRLNTRAFVALHRGATDEVRALAVQVIQLGRDGSLRLASALARILAGLSHLWDGNPRLAEQEMRPVLLQAEREEGRRSMIASLHASILAAALLQLDQPVAAQALLANRLDVIESCGFADNLLLAYRTLVYAALAQDDERRAMAVLDSMDAIARRRNLARLQLQCLAERIRLLSIKQCDETVAELLPQLDALGPVFEQEALRPFLPQYELVAAIARTYAAISKGTLDDADRQLDQAAQFANALHRGRDMRAVKVLRAVVAQQRGSERALPMLMEAMNLASLAGNARLLANTHPIALDMATELKEGVVLPRKPARRPMLERPEPSASLLTAKEAEILRLLERGMSNKRIALTLDIGGETVKWHLKNLFSKLSAVSREHAVDRARLLGLVRYEEPTHH